jgi:hypothetical protein
MTVTDWNLFERGRESSDTTFADPLLPTLPPEYRSFRNPPP